MRRKQVDVFKKHTWKCIVQFSIPMLSILNTFREPPMQSKCNCINKLHLFNKYSIFNINPAATTSVPSLMGKNARSIAPTYIIIHLFASKSDTLPAINKLYVSYRTPAQHSAFITKVSTWSTVYLPPTKPHTIFLVHNRTQWNVFSDVFSELITFLRVSDVYLYFYFVLAS